MTEREYRRHPGMNFSSLSYLAQHPKYFKWKKTVKEDPGQAAQHFRVGGAIDTLLTDPAEYKNKYIVIDTYTPTGKMEVLCNRYIDYVGNQKLTRKEAFSQAYVDAKFSERSLKSTKEKFALLETRKYVTQRLASLKKVALSKDESRDINKVVKLLKESKHTKRFFVMDNKNKNLEYYHQKAIVFRLKGRVCKGLLDILIVDHKNKTIEPCDLKTTGKSVLSFGQSFFKFRYYLQAAFYSEAVRQWVGQQKIAGIDLSSYKILPFKFVVAEKNPYNLPMIFNVSEKDLEVGRSGGMYRGNPVKGYLQLLDDLTWHEKENYWEAHREIANRGFVSDISIFD